MCIEFIPSITEGAPSRKGNASPQHEASTGTGSYVDPLALASAPSEDLLVGRSSPEDETVCVRKAARVAREASMSKSPSTKNSSGASISVCYGVEDKSALTQGQDIIIRRQQHVSALDGFATVTDRLAEVAVWSDKAWHWEGSRITT